MCVCVWGGGGRLEPLLIEKKVNVIDLLCNLGAT